MRQWWERPVKWECDRYRSWSRSVVRRHDDLPEALGFHGPAHGEKTVRSLEGIGEVLGKKLKDKGFDKAFVVLGQLLVLKKRRRPLPRVAERQL